MAQIKLDYVNTFYVRGTLKHLFRRKGHKRVTIKGRPGSPEFMDHYHALLDQSGGPLSNRLSGANIGASRTKAGTIDALIVKYLQHDVFTKGLAKATQTMQRQILDNFRQCIIAATGAGVHRQPSRLAWPRRGWSNSDQNKYDPGDNHANSSDNQEQGSARKQRRSVRSS
jgi:hypothetical protein